MKRIMKTERRSLALFALFLICMSGWASYLVGSGMAQTRMQKEAIKRGYGFYKPTENVNAFEWRN